MSRSAFAERFTALVGESAMQYVLRWKMQTTLGWLKDQRGSVSDAAHRLGYASEASFSRAFKQVIGMAPGTARRASNETPNKWPAFRRFRIRRAAVRATE
jgi:AraC-like DNA-binding protein